MGVLRIFVPIMVAMVFAVVFLAAFPTVNTLIRSVPMPAGLAPIFGGEVAILPYAFCTIAFYIIILIVRNRIDS